MIKRVTQITIVPEGEPIFSELGFTVSIEDDAVGEYVTVRSMMEALKGGTISVHPSEWPALREAIDEMVNQCREDAE